MATTLLKNSRVLILGGGGLVGSCVAKYICRLPKTIRPCQLLIAALTQQEAERAIQEITTSSGQQHSEQDNANHSFSSMNGNNYKNGDHGHQNTSYPSIVPVWGDMFVRSELAHHRSNQPKEERLKMEHNAKARAMMIEDLYGDFSSCYQRNYLVDTIRKYRPHVVIDCINTATVFAYRDLYAATTKLQESLKLIDGLGLKQKTSEQEFDLYSTFSVKDLLQEDAEVLMLSQTGPQLIRHVRMLAQASREFGIQHYIKIGTTGTGGMGMNIPYTHSEDKPSQVLMSKTEAAYGHSGLLLHWAQTPGAPCVKEIKPAAAIGYRTIDVRTVADHFGNGKIYQSKCVHLDNKKDGGDLGINGNEQDQLDMRESTDSYTELGPLTMEVLDFGENGVFTKDEFLTITSPDQMEMITPEEIAEQVIEELLGVATGHNVLAAMRGSLLGPGYRAGIQRMKANIQLSNKLEKGQDQLNGTNELAINGVGDTSATASQSTTAPSIALGKLGPPQLSKLLFESNILLEQYGTYENLVNVDAKEAAMNFVDAITGVQAGHDLHLLHEHSPLLASIMSVAPSVGVPVLLEGNVLFRGPNISIPAISGHSTHIPCPHGSDLDRIAAQGWVDLREQNIELWKVRAARILEEQGHQRSSTAATDSRLPIIPSDMATWVLAHELDGHRDFISH